MARAGDDPSPWGGLEPEIGLQFGERPAFCLSEVRLYHFEDGEYKYGSDSDIVADFDALGVGVVRHPGYVQFYLDQVFQTSTSWGSREFPADATEIFNAVWTSAPWGNLQELLRAIHAQGSGLKVMITFLANALDAPAPGDPGYPNFTDANVSQPIAVRWDGHLASVSSPITDDYGVVSSIDTTGTGTPSARDMYSLDPTSPYKRYYVRMMADVVAWLLDDLRNTLLSSTDPFDIADHVAGIQVFNEAEGREDQYDSSGNVIANPQAWGRLWYECATAFKGLCDWLPIWLPGLSSYHFATGPGPNSWEGKVAFLRDFLAELSSRCDPSSPYYRGFALDELVDGADFHWFHKEEAYAERLAYLYSELAEVRSILDDAKLPDVSIGVLAAGVNVYCATKPTPPTAGVLYDAGCEYYTGMDWVAGYLPSLRPERTSTGTIPTPTSPYAPGKPAVVALAETGANDFQAMSVWWRWAVALAGGAKTVGLNDHVSDNSSSTFPGHGLRRDQHDAGKATSLAVQRVSWFAVQQFITRLGRATRVRLLLPDPAGGWPASRQDLDDRINTYGTWAQYNDVWAVEFRFPVADVRYGDHAYLLFIDPYGDARCADLTLRPASGGSATLVQVATQPFSHVPSYPGVLSLPGGVWQKRPTTTTTSGSFTFRLNRCDWPILVFAHDSLDASGLRVV